ncbi:MAG: class I SAM-dependent RNA methyltransferase, partial [Candidatus Adiutrix sp.]|nr:class I SAM-dependent RNA methyltransferase [Candidatus Adiutrix sp.]
VITGRSEEAVSAMVKQGRRFTLIALDPPRSGARDLAPALAALGPEMIMYVACHPAALARDLPAFSSLGYGLTNLTALDMFPRTSHLEALAVLVRT